MLWEEGHVFKTIHRSGEMARCFRELAAFAKDQSPVPSIISGSSQLHRTPAAKNLMPSSASAGTCTQNRYIHTHNHFENMSRKESHLARAIEIER